MTDSISTLNKGKVKYCPKELNNNYLHYECKIFFMLQRVIFSAVFPTSVRVGKKVFAPTLGVGFMFSRGY